MCTFYTHPLSFLFQNQHNHYHTTWQSCFSLSLSLFPEDIGQPICWSIVIDCLLTPTPQYPSRFSSSTPWIHAVMVNINGPLVCIYTSSLSKRVRERESNCCLIGIKNKSTPPPLFIPFLSTFCETCTHGEHHMHKSNFVLLLEFATFCNSLLLWVTE